MIIKFKGFFLHADTPFLTKNAPFLFNRERIFTPRLSCQTLIFPNLIQVRDALQHYLKIYYFFVKFGVLNGGVGVDQTVASRVCLKWRKLCLRRETYKNWYKPSSAANFLKFLKNQFGLINFIETLGLGGFGDFFYSSAFRQMGEIFFRSEAFETTYYEHAFSGGDIHTDYYRSFLYFSDYMTHVRRVGLEIISLKKFKSLHGKIWSLPYQFSATLRVKIFKRQKRFRFFPLLSIQRVYKKTILQTQTFQKLFEMLKGYLRQFRARWVNLVANSTKEEQDDTPETREVMLVDGGRYWDMGRIVPYILTPRLDFQKFSTLSLVQFFFDEVELYKTLEGKIQKDQLYTMGGFGDLLFTLHLFWLRFKLGAVSHFSYDTVGYILWLRDRAREVYSKGDYSVFSPIGERRTKRIYYRKKFWKEFFMFFSNRSGVRRMLRRLRTGIYRYRRKRKSVKKRSNVGSSKTKVVRFVLKRSTKKRKSVKKRSNVGSSKTKFFRKRDDRRRRARAARRRFLQEKLWLQAFEKKKKLYTKCVQDDWRRLGSSLQVRLHQLSSFVRKKKHWLISESRAYAKLKLFRGVLEAKQKQRRRMAEQARKIYKLFRNLRLKFAEIKQERLNRRKLVQSRVGWVLMRVVSMQFFSCIRSVTETDAYCKKGWRGKIIESPILSLSDFGNVSNNLWYLGNFYFFKSGIAMQCWRWFRPIPLTRLWQDVKYTASFLWRQFKLAREAQHYIRKVVLTSFGWKGGMTFETYFSNIIYKIREFNSHSTPALQFNFKELSTMSNGELSRVWAEVQLHPRLLRGWKSFFSSFRGHRAQLLKYIGEIYKKGSVIWKTCSLVLQNRKKNAVNSFLTEWAFWRGPIGQRSLQKHFRRRIKITARTFRTVRWLVGDVVGEFRRQSSQIYSKGKLLRFYVQNARSRVVRFPVVGQFLRLIGLNRQQVVGQPVAKDIAGTFPSLMMQRGHVVKWDLRCSIVYRWFVGKKLYQTSRRILADNCVVMGLEYIKFLMFSFLVRVATSLVYDWLTFVLVRWIIKKFLPLNKPAFSSFRKNKRRKGWFYRNERWYAKLNKFKWKRRRTRVLKKHKV